MHYVPWTFAGVCLPMFEFCSSQLGHKQPKPLHERQEKSAWIRRMCTFALEKDLIPEGLQKKNRFALLSAHGAHQIEAKDCKKEALLETHATAPGRSSRQGINGDRNTARRIVPLQNSQRNLIARNTAEGYKWHIAASDIARHLLSLPENLDLRCDVRSCDATCGARCVHSPEVWKDHDIWYMLHEWWCISQRNFSWIFSEWLTL